MASYSVASMFFHEYTLPEIFSFVSRAGLDGIEFWPETPDFWLRGMPVHEILACRKGHSGIATMTVHAPVLDLNPCSINPDVAEVSIDYAVRSVSIASQIGAGIVTVHPGRRTAKRPVSDADFVRFNHYIGRLREAVSGTGIRIGMENMEPAVNSLLCTPERVREILDEEPWLFFTLDIAHAMAVSDEEPLRYIALCHDRLVNVHLSRTQGRFMHLPLDKHPAVSRVFDALLDHHFTGSLTLEIEDLNMACRMSADEKVALLAREAEFMRSSMERQPARERAPGVGFK